MSNPSEGPWEVRETEDMSIDDDAPLWRTVVGNEGMEVAAAYGMTVEESEANADLIAAAPEMAVALEAIIAVYGADTPPTVEKVHAVWVLCTSALAKARGQT